jgi:hypothetical protein
MHFNYFASVNDDISDTIMHNMLSLTSKEKKLYVKSDELAQKVAVGKTLAEATIKAMTQRFIHSSIHPIDR